MKRESRYLYHFTPEERITSVMTRGLLPNQKSHMGGSWIKKAHPNGVPIFLTPFPSWIMINHGFAVLGTHYLLKVDVRGLELVQEQGVFINGNPSWFEFTYKESIPLERINVLTSINYYKHFQYRR